MPSKKKVCFACVYAGNIFLSYILSKTVYRNDYKILILSERYNKAIYSNIIEKCNIWDKVIIIKDVEGPAKFSKKIKIELSQIDFKSIDKIHCFNFPHNAYSVILFDYILENTQVIFTVSSMATYYYKERFLNLKSIKQYANMKLDLDRISEIWLYDKNLYVSKLLKRPLRDIELSKYISDNKLLNEFCNELNKIFSYKNESLTYDVIFFDQPVHLKCLSRDKERELFSMILNEFQNRKVLVKSHPRRLLEKYEDFKVGIINEFKVPWEVILLNEINNNRLDLNNKIFITYFSESLLTTCIILNKLNIPHKAIWLKELLQNNSEVTLGLERDSKMYNEFISIYQSINSNSFHDIKSIEELRNLLDNTLK